MGASGCRTDGTVVPPHGGAGGGHPVTSARQDRHREAVRRAIGPRQVGGRYRPAEGGAAYTVLAVDRLSGPTGAHGWCLVTATDEQVAHGLIELSDRPWRHHDAIVGMPAPCGYAVTCERTALWQVEMPWGEIRVCGECLALYASFAPHR